MVFPNIRICPFPCGNGSGIIVCVLLIFRDSVIIPVRLYTSCIHTNIPVRLCAHIALYFNVVSCTLQQSLPMRSGRVL